MYLCRLSVEPARLLGLVSGLWTQFCGGNDKRVFWESSFSCNASGRSGSDQEIPLLERPIALVVEDLHQASDLQIVGTFKGQFVVAGLGLEGFRSLPPADLMATLAYTHKHNLSSVHISLVGSYSLYDQSLPNEVFSQEVASDRPILQNVSEALSSAFVGGVWSCH